MALFRNICFTINNWTDDEYLSLAMNWHQWSTYLVMGLEVGDQGTPHIQGYAELSKRMRASAVAKIMPRAHFERRFGTAVEASVYCKKSGDFEEYGEISGPGARTDLDHVRQIADEGGMRTVVRTATLQQIRVAQMYLSYNETQRDFKPHVIWLYGPTGTGKSRKARELCGNDDVYTKNSGTKWWDGYDAHEFVIIDDFRPSWWDLTYMLALLDRYPMLIEYKGGQRQFLAKTIVVTSALPPNDCYVGTGEAVNQLLRRIDVVEHLLPTDHFVPPVVPEVAEVII